MNNTQKYWLISTLIHSFLWIVVLIVPVFLSSYNGFIDWQRVIMEWLRMWPFMVIFALNHWLFFRLLTQKRFKAYFILVISSILVVSLLNQGMPLLHDAILESFYNHNLSGTVELHFNTQLFLNNSFVCLMVVGLNNAIRMGLQWAKERKQMEQLEKENLKNQLDSLRNQISPHFFMNTLNNIHALIDYDKGIAKNAVVKLSKLMRVLLYETPANAFTLQKEISFLNDYIELMHIRISKNVDVKFDYPADLPDIKLPPLLFISFVENAFKHGIRATGKSFIHISFTIKNETLQFKITNSKAKTTHKDKKQGSIGLENAQKRFDLLYNKSYQFNIKDNSETFEVTISIPTNET